MKKTILCALFLLTLMTSARTDALTVDFGQIFNLISQGIAGRLSFSQPDSDIFEKHSYKTVTNFAGTGQDLDFGLQFRSAYNYAIGLDFKNETFDIGAGPYAKLIARAFNYDINIAEFSVRIGNYKRIRDNQLYPVGAKWYQPGWQAGFTLLGNVVTKNWSNLSPPAASPSFSLNSLKQSVLGGLGMSPAVPIFLGLNLVFDAGVLSDFNLRSDLVGVIKTPVKTSTLSFMFGPSVNLGMYMSVALQAGFGAVASVSAGVRGVLTVVSASVVGVVTGAFDSPRIKVGLQGALDFLSGHIDLFAHAQAIGSLFHYDWSKEVFNWNAFHIDITKMIGIFDFTARPAWINCLLSTATDPDCAGGAVNVVSGAGFSPQGATAQNYDPASGDYAYLGPPVGGGNAPLTNQTTTPFCPQCYLSYVYNGNQCVRNPAWYYDSVHCSAAGLPYCADPCNPNTTNSGNCAPPPTWSGCCTNGQPAVCDGTNGTPQGGWDPCQSGYEPGPIGCAGGYARTHASILRRSWDRVASCVDYVIPTSHSTLEQGVGWCCPTSTGVIGTTLSPTTTQTSQSGAISAAAFAGAVSSPTPSPTATPPTNATKTPGI